MVQQVLHNQVECKQTTYSHVVLILETFTGHQELKELNNNYYKSFKAHMETVKAHSGKPWILNLPRNSILGEVMADKGWTDISTLPEEQAMVSKGRRTKKQRMSLRQTFLFAWQTTGATAS